MPQFTDREDASVGDAVALALDIAPDIGSILITHYPDRDTLDTFRPGETDLEAVGAVHRAVATTLAGLGVDVIVQRADRAAFRRWMHGRDDTEANRRGWIDRARLLRGAEALRILGVDAAAAQRTKFGAAPGPLADRLLEAFDNEAAPAFDNLAQALLEAGRGDVLDLAIRKMSAHQGDEAADALEGDLLATAEGGACGPSGWAELVALPVALPARDIPDAAALGASFVAAGILPDSFDVRFLPGWRSPDALAELSPIAIRRVLLDLVAGVEPRDLPPGDTDDLARDGFGLLLGLQCDWDIPIWDAIAAGDLPDATGEDDEETPEQARRAGLFDRWRAAAFEAHEGCVPLALVAPSEVGDEIAGFLGEAAGQTDAIDDIRQFVAMVRREAGDEDVVGRLDIHDRGLELGLSTTGGRFLDSMTLAADRFPARADEMAAVIGTFVRIVRT
jgi:hypothetical protein